MAKLGPEGFVVGERYHHAVHFKWRTLYPDLKLSKSTLLSSHIDPVMIALEINVLAT
jgi:hypothetical protein